MKQHSKSIKVPKVIKPANKKTSLQNFGDYFVINSPMPPPSPDFTSSSLAVHDGIPEQAKKN